MIDRERVQQVVDMLKASSSLELAVRDGDSFVRVRRAPRPAARLQPAGASAPGSASDLVAGEAAAAHSDIVIGARLVGRFFHGKGPGQPPIVNVGDSVSADQVVATIEALGRITGVPSPEDGDFIEFLAEDGQPVGYGTPLLRLRRKQE